jgi:hypothetical protein
MHLGHQPGTTSFFVNFLFLLLVFVACFVTCFCLFFLLLFCCCCGSSVQYLLVLRYAEPPLSPSVHPSFLSHRTLRTLGRSLRAGAAEEGAAQRCGGRCGLEPRRRQCVRVGGGRLDAVHMVSVCVCLCLCVCVCACGVVCCGVARRGAVWCCVVLCGITMQDAYAVASYLTFITPLCYSIMYR